MKTGKNIGNGELPKLKQLATELLASEAPDLSVLDQLAALAAEIATQLRESSRQDLVAEITQRAPGILPAAAEEIGIRLTQAAVEELAALATLLDQAEAARAALSQADADLMAARERGDYGAMAPLALEAETQKNSLAALSTEFQTRIGRIEGGNPATDADPSEAPVATGDLGPPTTEAAAGEQAPEPILAEDAAETEADSGPEHRRLRDLIRQMRPALDAAG